MDKDTSKAALNVICKINSLITKFCNEYSEVQCDDCLLRKYCLCIYFPH